MNRIGPIGWRHGGFGLIVAALMVWGAVHFFADEPEIALTIGEPWEEMRQRSSATIAPATPGHYWFRAPETDARLRFVDPQYGFVTPLARFFTVGFDSEHVRNVRMSPQVEPLLLDDTLKVVLSLQEQWRKGGWSPVQVKDDPPFADTPEWRAQLRDINRGGWSYWHAGEKYKLMMGVSRFKDDRNPTEERYLIKLELTRQRLKQ